MSSLSAEVHTALAQLLSGLQSTDNGIRTQAEEALNTEWVSQRPDVLLMGLAEQMAGSTDEGVSRWENLAAHDAACSWCDGVTDIQVPDTCLCRRHLPPNLHSNHEGSHFRREQRDIPAAHPPVEDHRSKQAAGMLWSRNLQARAA